MPDKSKSKHKHTGIISSPIVQRVSHKSFGHLPRTSAVLAYFNCLLILANIPKSITCHYHVLNFCIDFDLFVIWDIADSLFLNPHT